MTERRGRGLVSDDTGSVLPLALGFIVLALAAVFVCVCATDLYITQKRLDSLADSAALAGADGFVLAIESGTAQATLTDAGVQEQAVSLLDALPHEANLVSAITPDGVSAEVTLQQVWHPPMLALFVPDGVSLSATARSRTALE